MRRLFIFFLAFVLSFNFALARKKEKAGEMKDSVYYDNDYGFSLIVPDDWNSSIKKEKSNVRLILTKKQYDIPTEYTHAPSYTQVPKVTVYADTSSMPLQMFVDSLLSDEYKSKQKNDILQEFSLLFGDYIPKKTTKIKIGDVEGILNTGERQYSLQVQKAGYQADRADLVRDFYAGSMFFIKKDNHIIMLHFICERRYFANLEQGFMKLLDGFNLTEDMPEKTKK
jgi:hypothetical protein